jgi:uncharacterized membrane protein YoaK (UPF0700 family)
VVHVAPDAASGAIVIAVLALAMGVRNATIRRIGGSDLTTTVLTTTIAHLAADSPLAGGSGTRSLRRTVAVLAMFCGALIGAVLLKNSLALPSFAAAGLVLVTWLFYVPPIRRRNLTERHATGDRNRWAGRLSPQAAETDDALGDWL